MILLIGSPLKTLFQGEMNVLILIETFTLFLFNFHTKIPFLTKISPCTFVEKISDEKFIVSNSDHLKEIAIVVISLLPCTWEVVAHTAAADDVFVVI